MKRYAFALHLVRRLHKVKPSFCIVGMDHARIYRIAICVKCEIAAVAGSERDMRCVTIGINAFKARSSVSTR